MTTSVKQAFDNKDTRLAMLQVLSDNSFDSVLITDATVQGKILYANKAFKNLTGHDPSEVIGKTPRILQGVGTDKKVIDRLAVALKNGKKGPEIGEEVKLAEINCIKAFLEHEKSQAQ